VSTAAVFLDIDKAFDTTWHPGLLYNLSKLHFSEIWVKLLISILSNWKFQVSVEGEDKYKQGCHKVPSCPQPRTVWKNDAPKTPGVYLAFFAYDTCIYTTDLKEGYVLRQLQRGLTTME
jgi:hypothetical protein